MIIKIQKIQKISFKNVHNKYLVSKSIINKPYLYSFRPYIQAKFIKKKQMSTNNLNFCKCRNISCKHYGCKLLTQEFFIFVVSIIWLVMVKQNYCRHRDYFIFFGNIFESVTENSMVLLFNCSKFMFVTNIFNIVICLHPFYSKKS